MSIARWSQAPPPRASARPKTAGLTGTAAWTFYAISQGILGIRPDYDGLRVDPCLPAQLSEVTVTRRFRGSLYRIHIRNLAGDEKGRLTLTVGRKARRRQPHPRGRHARGA